MVFDPYSKKQKKEENEYVFDMILPFPISNNALHGVYQNKVYLTATAKGYYETVKCLVYEEQVPMLTGRLKAEVWVYEPDKRRRDINNLTKSLFDALEGAKVYENDHNIDETFIKRCECVKGGKVRVRITTIGQFDERLNMKQLEQKKCEENKLEQNKMVLEKMGVTTKGAKKWNRSK